VNNIYELENQNEKSVIWDHACKRNDWIHLSLSKFEADLIKVLNLI